MANNYNFSGTVFSDFVSSFLRLTESAKKKVKRARSLSCSHFESILDTLFSDAVAELAVTMNFAKNLSKGAASQKARLASHSAAIKDIVTSSTRKRPIDDDEPVEVIDLVSDDESDHQDSGGLPTTQSKTLNGGTPCSFQHSKGGPEMVVSKAPLPISGVLHSANNPQTQGAGSSSLGNKKPTTVFIPGENKPKFQCPVENCGKLFRYKSSVREHQIAHQTFKRFRCKYPQCSFATKYRSNARDHIKKRHLKGQSVESVQQYLEVLAVNVDPMES